MTEVATEPQPTTPFDVYANTDQLESSTLDVIATRLEARYARPEFQQMMVEYLEAMLIDQAETVLDLGCGTGVAARYITGLPTFNGRVTAVDLSDELLVTGRRLAAAEGCHQRIDFRQGDSRRLDLPDNAFDAVVAHTLISHVDDLDAVLTEIARVARPGALIGIFDGDYSSLTFSHPDPTQGKAYDELLIGGLITQPRVMRQLPELLVRAGLDHVAHFGYVVTDVGRADFWAPALDSFRRLLPASGVMSASDAEQWVEARYAESARGVFFGSSNYYAFVARKA